jgi:hypothetical protein
MPHRDPLTAAHEAAHVVVGVALGLRFRAAAVGYQRDPELGWVDGCVTFDRRYGSADAWAIMFAAGVYYEERRGHPTVARGDRAYLRYACKGSAASMRTSIVAAGAILESRRAAWDAVTRALLERDLTAADVERLAQGETISHAAE